MTGSRIRSLTVKEIALAREVFGDDLRVDTIRFFAAPWPLTRAFVPGRWFGRDWIVWPRQNLLPDLLLARLQVQAVFIHELVHVWQAQQGLNLLLGKLRAGDSLASYTYPLGAECRWNDLNIEQQAMVVEHRFKLSRGGKVPADREFYERICPIGKIG